MKNIIRTIIIVFSLLAVGTAVDGLFNNGILIEKAQARVGRPMTPASAAGVARRTTRRVIRHTTVYVATLPRGYTTVVVEGVSLYHYGGKYYQVHGSQYVVVVVD